jgi:hypothetical protein
VIRDMAMVRNLQAFSSGFSMALEMVTLGDTEISMLVRLTNLAAKTLEANQSDNAKGRLIAVGGA